MFPEARPVVFPEDNTGAARPASVGFVSAEVDWFLFSTWGPPPPQVERPDWHWAAGVPSLLNAGGGGVIEFDHIVERLVLTILESVLPDSEVFGYLTNPKHEIPIRKLTVQDHQADGLVLYGLDGKGAAIGITLRTYPPSP
jgi:hypothetical protein